MDFHLELEKEKEPMNFRLELEKDLDVLDDDDEEGEEEEAGASSSSSKAAAKPDDYNDEEWEIKSSIGLDCTLDNEEEEDEYDKVAVGEKDGNYLYMKDVNDYETEADSFREIPTSFKDAIRDPRANHLAAKLRLKEDAEATKKRLEEDVEAANKINSLRVTEDDDPPASVDAQIRTSEDGSLKSILKRKDTGSDSKSQKRVRFDSECKLDDGDGSDGTKDAAIKATVSEQESGVVQDYSSQVPDYIRNPSRYTHYNFDSLLDVDEESNRQAYMDFLNLVKKSDATESRPDDSSDDLKSVTFIPRRKNGDVTLVESSLQSKQNRVDLPPRIAAGDDEACMMEEDEPQEVAGKKASSQRSGRQYRMKPSSEEID